MILFSKFKISHQRRNIYYKKKEKVANNDFTGKKKVFMRGQFSQFFFIEVSAKKKKNVRKEAGTLRNQVIYFLSIKGRRKMNCKVRSFFVCSFHFDITYPISYSYYNYEGFKLKQNRIIQEYLGPLPIFCKQLSSSVNLKDHNKK